MASPTHTAPHSTLKCSLRGATSTSTVQFRNLKYASIPARYQESVASNTLKVGADGVYNATQFGPSCPHKRGGQAWDLKNFLGNVSLPGIEGQVETEKMDEFECLHANVTVPNSALAGERKSLPVLVWVHGGGLAVGSNNWPQYDLRKLVERSVQVGKPIIGVAINYRVGILGNLTSDKIESAGNMGFKDQVLGFQWVKKHIAGFGGNPDDITAAGESAGGISVSTLLCAETGTQGLFNRVVVMSGDVTLRKPRTKWWHEQMYKDQAQFFGINATDENGLKRQLLDADAETMVQSLPLAQTYCAHVDGKWLKEDVSLATLSSGSRTEHKPSWCKEFVVGDTLHDGLVLKSRILDLPQAFERFKTACEKHLTASETQRLLSAYKLDGTPTPVQTDEMLLALVSELRFYLPTRQIYKGWKAASPSNTAGRYYFHVPNPFEGEHTGLAAHESDVAYLLQHFNDQFDERNRKVAYALADQFLGYVNGEGWIEDGKLIVFDGDGIKKVDGEEYDSLYRDGRGKVLDSMDPNKLWAVADMWQNVRSEDEERTPAR